MEIDLPVGKLILCTHNEHVSPFGEAFFRGINGSITVQEAKDRKDIHMEQYTATNGRAQ